MPGLLINRSPMPGLGLSMGITLTMLSLVVLGPIGALLAQGASYGLEGIWATVNRERVWAALELSFRLSFLAALFNLVFGVALAWVLVRYDFPAAVWSMPPSICPLRCRPPSRASR